MNSICTELSRSDDRAALITFRTRAWQLIWCARRSALKRWSRIANSDTSHSIPPTLQSGASGEDYDCSFELSGAACGDPAERVPVLSSGVQAGSPARGFRPPLGIA